VVARVDPSPPPHSQAAERGDLERPAEVARKPVDDEAPAHAPSQSKEYVRAKKLKRRKTRRSWGRRILITLGVLALILIGARLALPFVLLWYVNDTIDRNPLYDGKVGDIDVSLWRGAYTIKDIRLDKVTGNVPVPLFSAPRVDLAVEWHALLHGKIVGRIVFDKPELNFVDGSDSSEDQTGSGGPWLSIIRDLFPFKINSAVVHDGSIHFRAFASKPPLDLPLTNLEATVENLTNVQDDITPMAATVKATGLALGHARLETEMKIDPFSYKPTFQLAFRLLGLDVTKLNDLANAYGGFDFEDGWFNLVIELNGQEGQLNGYVKPLFRHLKVFNPIRDAQKDNPIQYFWEAIVGAAAEILKNQPRDQVATLIPMTGNVSNPNQDILATIGNVLRNAFIRAYLPRLQGVAQDVDGLQFGPGSITDPPVVGAKE
jgi:hypothetical protein